ncbi:MAG: helix-turn-helix transcriptional regulator, partial [Candidatus Omnitrophota bacterium]
MDIKQRIKFLREKAHLSQKELAAKLDVVPGAVCNWEKGTNGPNPTQRKKLCEVFKINEADIYGAPSVSNEIPPDILEALQDPSAVKALLVTFTNKQ